MDRSVSRRGVLHLVGALGGSTAVGAHYLIGDQISYHPGWQEGAIHSAFHAIADIDQRVREQPSEVAAA